MSSFEQGGCDPPFQTKKELKAAVAENAHSVLLTSTSAFGGWSGLASDLPEGTSFNVVGPDPFRSRKWYATVERNKKGVVVVT